MTITEVQIKLADDDASGRLHAYAVVVIERCLCIRDLKIIEGSKGLFVAMPSRRLRDRCPGCGTKNHILAKFCNECGGRLAANRAERDEDGRSKLYSDIAHPITSTMRDEIEQKVLAAYRAKVAELALAGERGAA